MKTLVTSILALSLVFLAGCASNVPMTEEEQASQYGLSVEQFREEKKAAARMNMNLDEHLKMMDN